MSADVPATAAFGVRVFQHEHSAIRARRHCVIVACSIAPILRQLYRGELAGAIVIPSGTYHFERASVDRPVVERGPVEGRRVLA
ncbi:MAG TPA: hypothetical protein VFP84_06560 [Kofleriaceae bacterium]|nr:hypothetical protein [Kofleriaceae bacterium]